MALFLINSIDIHTPDTTPKYKLTYFNGTGRAEPLKFMFAYKDVEYEDCRIKMSDWESFKPKTLYGHLPILEVDGEIIAESYAMMRYVAKQLDLLGKNYLEAAKADGIMDYLKVCYDHKARKEILYGKDKEEQFELKEKFAVEIAAPYFSKLNQIIRENGNYYLVGDDFTWADFGVAYYTEEIERHSCHRPISLDYPALSDHQTRIFNLPGVKEWIDTRPEGEF